ncbi:type II secretion system secretin GspD [Psychromonas sp. PT13]|uniref:type II secretion system secretin GspD n=1 Tax=Psychromonas sp. PT13 TaxID=3439547 RepID=UPI003EB717F7
MLVITFLCAVGSSNIVFATEFSPSFHDADIEEFINVVGKNLHKTIIISPNVRGQVNVRSYDTLDEKQYYQFFLNVLEVYGFAVIEMDNNVLKVIKSKDAKISGPAVIDGDSSLGSDEMVTRIVSLKNVSGRELAPLLRKLNDNSGGGNVVYYDPSNVIMLTGRAAVINKLVEIIERVDQAGNQDVDIVNLNYSNATDMIALVNSVQNSSGSGDKNKNSDILQANLVADERTNSLIISGDEQSRERVIKLIKSLDTEVKKQYQNNNQIRVFYLEYATASDVVTVLQGVSGSIQNGAQSVNLSQGQQGQQNNQDQVGNQGRQGGPGSGGQNSNSQSNRSQNNQSSHVQQSSNSNNSNGSNTPELSIVADTGTNSIIISAQPQMMLSLTSLIHQLDIRRAQVLVEAIIVEVSQDDGIGLNSQFASNYGGTSFSDNGVSTSDLISAYISAEEDDDYDDAADALSDISGSILGFGDSDWAFIIQAVSTDSTANILSTPSITTLDNEEASFVVGDEVPVITGSSSSSSSSETFSTVEREEVGIKLKVTPQINKGDTVKLNIEQEVSSIQGSTSVDIIFATRSVKTTVLAKSGATIVLGGLIAEEVSESVSKVPWLGDLPYIGWLFRSTISSTEKSNLMVFMRATILRDDESMDELSRHKYELIRDIQQAQRKNGINLMPNSDAPILPEWGHSHEINPDDFIAVQNMKSAEAQAKLNADNE